MSIFYWLFFTLPKVSDLEHTHFLTFFILTTYPIRS